MENEEEKKENKKPSFEDWNATYGHSFESWEEMNDYKLSKMP